MNATELLERYEKGERNFEDANLRRADLWCADLEGADLEGADLEGADLRCADLRRANLRRADLCCADLRRADLWCADLEGADLEGAYLEGADLRCADLEGADLEGADLEGADLRCADLRCADLRCADLRRADLWCADLRETALDPLSMPNSECSDFETIDGGQWCVGYRTQNSPHLGGRGYHVGDLIEAPYFSTCSTECHPGIFVLPTVEDCEEWGDIFVKVIFRQWECHRAGSKWRVKWLIVWEDCQPETTGD
jgi:hypothetical protein